IDRYIDSVFVVNCAFFNNITNFTATDRTNAAVHLALNNVPITAYIVNNTFSLYDDDNAMYERRSSTLAVDGDHEVYLINNVSALPLGVFFSTAVAERTKPLKASNNTFYCRSVVNANITAGFDTEFVNGVNNNVLTSFASVAALKEATAANLKIATAFSTGNFVPYLPVLDKTSLLVNTGTPSYKINDVEFVPQKDIRGFKRVKTDRGAYEVSSYAVLLPSVEGVASEPAAGIHDAFEGEDFTFTLTVDRAYKDLEVKAGEEILTGVDGAYTHSCVDKDSVISFSVVPKPIYTVTLPEVEGVVTDSVAGNYSVYEGDDFTFSVTLQADYANLEVKIGNEALLPDNEGVFIISDINSNVTVSISVVYTSVMQVEAENPALRILPADGGFTVEPMKNGNLSIYSASGFLYTSRSILKNSSETFRLPAGLYVIRMNEKSQKVIVK
ncbi:MAG: hypothetical protein LBS07_05995, partial [Prevotellaceae bacterium]|nr:hypothetical protein [Prevotellaceae bacterium]